jgi:hypothetical protein
MAVHRLWGLMGYSHQDEADVTRINSTSARTARHIANIAATLQVDLHRQTVLGRSCTTSCLLLEDTAASSKPNSRQQELGPWCAAAALSAVLQPSVRNMYTSGEGRQQGADALGLPDAPPMGLADAWSAAAPILCMGYLELQIMCIECPQC